MADRPESAHHIGDPEDETLRYVCSLARGLVVEKAPLLQLPPDEVRERLANHSRWELIEQAAEALALAALAQRQADFVRPASGARAAHSRPPFYSPGA